jgi:arginase family enzyme
VGCHKKMGFPFYHCVEGPNEHWFFVRSLPRAGYRKAPLKFKRYGTLKDDHTVPVVSSIFSSACIYCILDIRMFKIKFELQVHQHTSNSLEENTMRCETPETMHVILGHTVHLGTLSAHCRLDLRLRCCQRWPKKS